MSDLATFLGGHTPFQAMPDADLTALAERSEVVDFPAGATVADYATPSDGPGDGGVWMVRRGRVALLDAAGAEIDDVAAGGIFGYTPLLTGAGADFSARTAEPVTLIRLPDDAVRARFAEPAGLAYLAGSAWQPARSGAGAPAFGGGTDGRPVGELIHGEPLLVDPATTVRDAVVAMTARRVSYALVRRPDGAPGIFTDRDLRTRVVAAGLAVDVPISAVMSAPARTVTADRTAETVLLEMLDAGLRHMPVVAATGAVLGVLEDADLLASSARLGFAVRRAIDAAADAADLRAAGREVTGLAPRLYRNGTTAAATSAIVSVVIDALVRKAVRLAASETGLPVGADVAWLLLGSVARREAMPSSDVDSALSWADDPGSTGDPAENLRAAAARAEAILDACGLPPDRNGAVASSPIFARSRARWEDAARGWLDDPLRDRGLILSSLMIDARVVTGDPALNPIPDLYRRMRAEHPRALRLTLREALAARIRARSLRDVLSRRGGTVDLKTHLATPIVNLARWGGLTAGVGAAGTAARLRAGAGAGAFTERDARMLGDVFTMVQRLRMSHQVEQCSAGRPAADVVTMSELSPLHRSLLAEGMREVAAVARRIRNAANWAG